MVQNPRFIEGAGVDSGLCQWAKVLISGQRLAERVYEDAQKIKKTFTSLSKGLEGNMALTERQNQATMLSEADIKAGNIKALNANNGLSPLRAETLRDTSLLTILTCVYERALNIASYSSETMNDLLIMHSDLYREGIVS